MKLGPFDFLPLETDVSLRTLHTFGIEAQARYLIRIWDEAILKAFIEANAYWELPHLVLSGGSNMLFRKNFEGVVLKNEVKGREVIEKTEEHVLLKLGAGENWHEVVQYCLAEGWGGIENLSLIPGSVGAAPIQNIGAYGIELKDCFEYLEAINLYTGKTYTFNKEACQFGYRDSFFKRQGKSQFFITRVVLKLSHSKHQINSSYGAIGKVLEEQDIHNPSPRDISEVVCKIRRSKLPDPAELGNAGSFFKNPLVPQTKFETLLQHYSDMPHYPDPSGNIKIPAAWLIQQCGWKGKREGAYGVYEKQALVLVNYGGAKGQEIYELSERILHSVKQTFGIELEREVQII